MLSLSPSASPVDGPTTAKPTAQHYSTLPGAYSPAVFGAHVAAGLGGLSPAGGTLLDEPSTALDAGSRRRIHALLGNRDQRPATLLVTHDPAEAADLADRVLELTAGQIAGTPPL